MSDPILVARLQAENDALRSELDETNQGVLALYAALAPPAEPLPQASALHSRLSAYMRPEFRTPPGLLLRIA